MDLIRFLLLVSVLGSCSGDRVLPEGPVYALVGTDVTLETLRDGSSYTIMIWNFNGGSDQVNVATVVPGSVKVDPAYEGRVSVNTSTGTLQLKSVRSEDRGDFAITVVDSKGTHTSDILLQVLAPVSDVNIKSNLPEAIEHNSTVELTCSAQGSSLTFTWTKGSAPLLASERIVVKNMDSSSTLSVKGILRTDLIGPIYCTAANQLEKKKSPAFNLTVYYGPDKTSIAPPTPPQFIRSGSNFSLSCSAQSDPPASFSWFCNQKPMAVSGPVLTLKQIQDLKLGQKAETFTCRAKNSKTKLEVPSPAVSFTVMEAITGTTVSGPASTLMAGNSSANLSCQATAGTVVTRIWTKDGHPLSAGSGLVFSEDKSSLMIKVLQKEDGGEYTCQLTNPVNTDKASFKMVVNFGPEPAMVAGEDAVEVTDPVTLTCAALSVPPANFTWKFNGSVTDVKTAQYSIAKAVYKNTGTYTCEAFNAITGKTSSVSHKLSVKEEGALDEGLSDGAIAGIIIAVLVALGAAIGLIIYCRQKVPVESPY